MTRTLKTAALIEIAGVQEEYPLTVTYEFIKASGDGWNEPREPAHIEVDGAVLQLGDQSITVPLTDAQRRALEGECGQDYQAEEDPDRAYEAHRDRVERLMGDNRDADY